MTTQRFDTAELGREVEDILVRSAGLAPSAFADTGGTLLELGLDSLASMELQAVVLDRYGVHIPEDALEMRVQEIADFIAENAENAVNREVA
ncbi:acyl carrier protein [Actinokineospora enzanensis]|uniref:acyl carrier protein n=1 Tax=Actinokineospora enzanensis TaxID=155975 RepID=UPI0003A37443|nr:acyl carrier protein [Actinokineospora enzanensis]